MIKIEIRNREEQIDQVWPAGKYNYMLVVTDGKRYAVEIPFVHNNPAGVAQALEDAAGLLREVKL